ncbi:MAG: MaoC family dehydratase [Chitinophagaceae bacterium]
MTNIKVGDSASTQKNFTAEEVFYYCQNISGDMNPVHVDEKVAQAMNFDHCIVPGILSSSLFGGLLGSTLPDARTVHLGQNSRFHKPVYVGETVVATITVIAVREDKPIATFYCVVKKENGELAVEGEAVVKFPLSN